MRHAENAIRQSPNAVGAYLIYSDAATRLRKFDLAENKLRKAAELAPNDPDVIHGLGTVLLELKRPSEAVPYLTTTIEMSPQNGTAWADRAIAQNMLGLRKLAISDANEACLKGYKLGCDLVKEFGAHN